MKPPGGDTGVVLPDHVESMRFSPRSLFISIKHHSGHLQNSPQESPVRKGKISGHNDDIAVSLLTLLPFSSITAPAGPFGSLAFAEGPSMQFVGRPRVWYVRLSKQYGVLTQLPIDHTLENIRERLTSVLSSGSQRKKDETTMSNLKTQVVRSIQFHFTLYSLNDRKYSGKLRGEVPTRYV